MTYSTPENYQSPVLQWHEKSQLWRLVEDYTQEWGEPNFRKRFFMAAGYEYDKASTKGLARHDQAWEGPSLWHDRHRQEKGKFPHPELFRFETQMPDGSWKPDLSPWSINQVDEFLEYDGRLAGVPKLEALKFKLAVMFWARMPWEWGKWF